MGKATIAGGGTDGNYEITVDYGKAARDAKVAALATKIAELSPKITDAQEKYDAEKVKVDAAAVLVSEAIEAYVLATKTSENPDDWKDELAAFQKRQTDLFAAQAKAEPLRLALNDLKSEKAQAVKDKGYWEGLELEVTQQAWCVDLTEGATGEVATVDVPGESAQILIAPGGAPPTGQDGVLVAREVQRGDQLYFNAAILPGWQKFKPTYRIGVINAINEDADTADVTLVDAISSAQSLSINRYTDLPDTPINYMTCNARAFEVGDRVVIQFEDGQWNAPRVIGFESNPRPCHPEFVYLPIGVYQRDLTVTGSDYAVHQGLEYVEYDGPPVYFYPFTGWATPNTTSTARPMSANGCVEFTGDYFFAEDEEDIGAEVDFDGFRIVQRPYYANPEQVFSGYRWFTLSNPTQVLISVNTSTFSVVNRTWQKVDSFTAYFLPESGPVAYSRPVVPFLTPFADDDLPRVASELGMTPPFYDETTEISTTSGTAVGAWLQENGTFPPVEVVLSGKGIFYEYESCAWDASRNQWVLEFKRPAPTE